MKLPSILKELRAEKGLTQDELSNKLSINRATYAHYETGRRQPDAETLQLLADCFSVSVDYLLGRTDVKNPDKFKSNYQHSKEDLEKLNVLTSKDEKEIEKKISEIKESLTKQDGLMLSGEPASEEALESILDALEYGMRQAKRINKKYTPKKYRKEDKE
ncbi:helix-turn-helix domain-containing protein [Natronincola ferrireducens]|uniref:DNA-binding transcriptional regulator, XRE-family HTH domain n=1 Tax=Natronincola ferrireducens TaxID=393762 RepID=A0A1G9I1T9_9FIRM|nr:helix-turn-helix transcriptional regulator [Natronincola ferrireducens]SDL19208.1 DNA-binding transcriptional regulator, XRE-family HTH domain [Natronincola ferrireducens]